MLAVYGFNHFNQSTVPLQTGYNFSTEAGDALQAWCVCAGKKEEKNGTLTTIKKECESYGKNRKIKPVSLLNTQRMARQGQW